MQAGGGSDQPPHAGEGGRLPVLYHCRGARSFRVLWALEELGLPYALRLLPFPPRFLAPAYLEINPLGTIPFLQLPDGTGMTESSAIVEWLAAKHPQRGLAVAPDDPAYPRYLNFLHMADATLTFPQTLVLRYTRLEPPERRVPQVVEDYRRWFLKRLEGALGMFGGRYCCGERFTAADIAVGYAIDLARTLGLWDDLPGVAREYHALLAEREGYERAKEVEQEKQ